MEGERQVRPTAIFDLCEGCKRRSEIFTIHIGKRVFGVCEVCYARLSLLERRFPAVFQQIADSPDPGKEHFEFPKISPNEVYEEAKRLRKIRAGQMPEDKIYAESVIRGRLLEQGRQAMRNFDDTEPLHPIPLLGIQKEPDELPPQVADNEKLCKLSTSDKLILHGLEVCWNAGDEDALPKPTKPKEELE